MREKKSTCVVFGFGTATLDFRIHVADLGENYKGKLLARESNILGGGAIANCLVQVARLNGRACWLGKLGVDWLAREILRLLDEEGVDVSKVLRDSTLCSPFNLAVYTEDSRRRVGEFLLPNSLAELKAEDIEVMINHICENDWVITEIGEIPLGTTLSFCKSTVNKGAKLAVDVDLDPLEQCIGDLSTLNKIFNLSDVIIPNGFAMRSIYGNVSQPELSEIISERFKVPVVVTAGADGAYFCIPGQEPVHQPPFETEMVDTIGAGDAFHGGLMFGLSHQWSLSKAVELGALCGAHNCGNRGARKGMPTAEEINLNTSSSH